MLKQRNAFVPSEEKLQISELRYRRLFETAQDGILILDADTGQIVDANPFLKELLGYSHGELLGKELWEIGVFKDIVDSKAAFSELQNNGYIRYKDLPLQTKDGRSIDVEFVSNVYMVDKKRVIQCNIRDITDRRKAELLAMSRARELERLSKSQEETKKAMLNVMEDLEEARALIEVEKAKDDAMLASIGEGLIAIDNKKKILVINKAAEHALGWKKHDLVGKNITILRLEDEEGAPVPLDGRPAAIALATGKATSRQYFYVKKDKTKVPIAINVTPIWFNKQIVGAVIIFRDITREKEIDRAKSEFVSLASHQLRTPLGVIKWYLETLTHEAYVAGAPVVVRNYIAEIYKSNERVLSLVRDLLSVSRIEQGRVKNVSHTADLLQIVREVVEQMKIVADKKKITLHITIPVPTIPAVTIDVLRFREVIENLVENAIAYTPVGGSVDVLAHTRRNALYIRVQDTGMGVAAPDQKKLFTKFFRSEKAVEHNPEGSGLGLYVVKSYVEGWGGTISAHSREGRGSTFTIRMPMSQKKFMSKGGDIYGKVSTFPSKSKNTYR